MTNQAIYSGTVYDRVHRSEIAAAAASVSHCREICRGGDIIKYKIHRVFDETLLATERRGSKRTSLKAPNAPNLRQRAASTDRWKEQSKIEMPSRAVCYRSLFTCLGGSW